MNLDRAIFLLAGTLTLLSASLTLLVSEWWVLLAAFVGLNLLQSEPPRSFRRPGLVAQPVGVSSFLAA
ncbi:hypothetical protein [Nocardioides sp.]|uniref:hypothetical protein n=1 Tax=Nocardioides sp. TaxID=35761 RepID=UPI0019BFB30C|nr:hypothetical protein [Nocardioides sp.]MBC7279766.1 DUF2892 domain-containing protein [Nocardioides sp.]